MPEPDDSDKSDSVLAEQGCAPTLVLLFALTCVLSVIPAFVLSRGVPAGYIPVVCGLLMMVVFGWRWARAGSTPQVSRRYHAMIKGRYLAKLPPFEVTDQDPDKMVQSYIRYEARQGIAIGLFVMSLGIAVLLFSR